MPNPIEKWWSFYSFMPLTSREISADDLPLKVTLRPGVPGERVGGGFFGHQVIGAAELELKRLGETVQGRAHVMLVYVSQVAVHGLLCSGHGSRGTQFMMDLVVFAAKTVNA